jgi:hypothetical protein
MSIAPGRSSLSYADVCRLVVNVVSLSSFNQVQSTRVGTYHTMKQVTLSPWVVTIVAGI